MGIRLLEFLAIAKDLAVAQANTIPRNSNDSLHDVHVGRAGIHGKEHHNVAAMNVGVLHDRLDPAGAGRELHPVHKDMITDQQRPLHRGRRNLERLNDERNNEKPSHQHARERGKKLHGSLSWLFVFQRGLRLLAQSSSLNEEFTAPIAKFCSSGPSARCGLENR